MKDLKTNQERSVFYSELGDGNALARRALCHIRALNKEYAERDTCSLAMTIDLTNLAEEISESASNHALSQATSGGVPRDPEDMRSKVEAFIAKYGSGTTSLKWKAEHYDEVWELARSLGFSCVTDAINGDKVESIEQVLAEFRAHFAIPDNYFYDPDQGLWGGFKMPMAGSEHLFEHAELATASWHGYRAAKGLI